MVLVVIVSLSLWRALFADALLADRPALGAYVEQVYAWATAEARCERFRIFHAEKGFLDADGAVRGGQYPALYEQQAQRYREALGLTPLSDATLAKTRAEAILSTVDLESIRQRGREALARREQLEAKAAAIEVEG